MLGVRPLSNVIPTRNTKKKLKSTAFNGKKMLVHIKKVSLRQYPVSCQKRLQLDSQLNLAPTYLAISKIDENSVNNIDHPN